jgi:hypothetical protein
LAEGPSDWPDLAAHWHDGRIKLALTRQLLGLRHRFADIFQRGSYEPLPVAGPHADHVIAFARGFKRQRLVIAVGRHFAPLSDGGRQWPAGREEIIDPLSESAEPKTFTEKNGSSWQVLIAIANGELRNRDATRDALKKLSEHKPLASDPAAFLRRHGAIDEIVDALVAGGAKGPSSCDVALIWSRLISPQLFGARAIYSTSAAKPEG